MGRSTLMRFFLFSLTLLFVIGCTGSNKKSGPRNKSSSPETKQNDDSKNEDLVQLEARCEDECNEYLGSSTTVLTSEIEATAGSEVQQTLGDTVSAGAVDWESYNLKKLNQLQEELQERLYNVEFYNVVKGGIAQTKNLDVARNSFVTLKLRMAGLVNKLEASKSNLLSSKLSRADRSFCNSFYQDQIEQVNTIKARLNKSKKLYVPTEEVANAVSFLSYRYYFFMLSQIMRAEVGTRMGCFNNQSNDLANEAYTAADELYEIQKSLFGIAPTMGDNSLSAQISKFAMEFPLSSIGLNDEELNQLISELRTINGGNSHVSVVARKFMARLVLKAHTISPVEWAHFTTYVEERIHSKYFIARKNLAPLCAPAKACNNEQLTQIELATKSELAEVQAAIKNKM